MMDQIRLERLSLWEAEPLIRADVVSLICADLRTEGSGNQRFLLLPKTNRTVTEIEAARAFFVHDNIR